MSHSDTPYWSQILFQMDDDALNPRVERSARVVIFMEISTSYNKSMQLQEGFIGQHSEPENTLAKERDTWKSQVQEAEILERVKSRKDLSSYELRHQLSLRWSTEVGPRIGCVADYPRKVRLTALELVDPSPGNHPPAKPSNFAFPNAFTLPFPNFKISDSSFFLFFFFHFVL